MRLLMIAMMVMASVGTTLAVPVEHGKEAVRKTCVNVAKGKELLAKAKTLSDVNAAMVQAEFYPLGEAAMKHFFGDSVEKARKNASLGMSIKFARLKCNKYL
jgi:hypothetical protein